MGSTTVSADATSRGQHRQKRPQRLPTTPGRRRWATLIALIGAVSVAVAIVITFAIQGDPVSPASQQGRFTLPTTPGSYVGLYPEGVPGSYGGVTAFTAATGVRPDVVPYYSGWLEPFQASFARAAADNGAVPLVQMDPESISVAGIASGKYDSYLITTRRPFELTDTRSS